MLFNSFIFLIFGALFYWLWPHFKNKEERRYLFLIIASFIFYGWWDWRFIFLLVANGLLVYYTAIAMAEFPRFKKGWLSLALLGNLGCLMLFKYLGFFTENINSIAHLFGLSLHVSHLSLVLPLGISFFTFECLSYAVDVYKDELKPTRSLLHFFAFLSLFPHLIAGPIIRASDLLPQLKKVINPTEVQKWEGYKLIVFGFFKKVVIADNLAPAVNAAFSTPAPEYSMLYWWVIMLMFAFQIFCDFSGYSDIARGLTKWMGYELPVNFDHPYVSRSFREFWGRWHISLSTWFRDYVYIPIGGSKNGLLMGLYAMWVTMLVSGFWHGAAWTFVIWGALHALYLSVERLTRWQQPLDKLPVLRHLVVLLILIQVLVAWVFFRAATFTQAMAIVGLLFDFSHPAFRSLHMLKPFPLFALGIIFLWEFLVYVKVSWVAKRREETLPVGGRFAPVFIEAAVLLLMIVASVYCRGPGGAFIYFQF